MVAGGFALGVALQETGLAKHMIEAIPFSTWPPVLMIVGSGLICYAMANFISHTATAALLVPILAIAGISHRNDTAKRYGKGRYHYGNYRTYLGIYNADHTRLQQVIINNLLKKEDVKSRMIHLSCF